MGNTDLIRIVRMLYPGPGWQSRRRSKGELYSIYTWAKGLPESNLGIQEKIDLVIETYGHVYWSQLQLPTYNFLRMEIVNLVSRIILNKRGEETMSIYKFKIGEVVYNSELQASVKIADIYRDHVRFVTLDGTLSDIVSKDKDSILEPLASYSLTVGKIYRVGESEVEVIGFDSKRNEVIIKYVTTTNNKRYAYKAHELRPRGIQLVNGGIYDIRIGGKVSKVKVLGIDKVNVIFIDTELREFSVRTNQIDVGFGTMKVLKQYEV